MKKALTLFKVKSLRQILFILILVSGCTPAPVALAALPAGCTSPGEILRAELSQPTRGYPYHFRVYLPPCYSAGAGIGYPVLYLIPGRGGTPDTWFAAGLASVANRLILERELSPFIIVTTENTDSDPMAVTIHDELIPWIEGQYPILDDRRYRAVAGGSLGGIAAYRLAFQYPDEFSGAGIFGAGAISGEEEQIKIWLSSMTAANRTRVFMETGDEDIFMLERARVMKSILDETGMENQLHAGHGGHNYSYWVSKFEIYLKWLANEW